MADELQGLLLVVVLIFWVEKYEMRSALLVLYRNSYPVLPSHFCREEGTASSGSQGMTLLWYNTSALKH